jgi:hypothetical protein
MSDEHITARVLDYMLSVKYLTTLFIYRDNEILEQKILKCAESS